MVINPPENLGKIYLLREKPRMGQLFIIKSNQKL